MTDLAALVRQAKDAGLIPTESSGGLLPPWRYGILVDGTLKHRHTPGETVNGAWLYNDAVATYRKEMKTAGNSEVRLVRRRRETDQWEPCPLPENY